MLAPDPAVPQRDALLDERLDGAAARRRAAASASTRSTASATACASSTAPTPTASSPAARSAGRSRSVFRRAAAASEPGAVLHVEELETVFWTFPLRPPARRAARCSTAAPARSTRSSARPVARTRLMAYAPERAATVECRDGRRRGARLREGPLGRRRARARQRRGRRGARSAPATRTCGCRACSRARCRPARWRLEPLAGDRLDGIADLAPALRALGAALAHAARRPPAAGAALRPARPGAARARRRGDRPRAARLRALPRSALLARLADGPPECEPVHLHGDANLRNALLDGGRVGLVDLEDAAAGPAAADLGFVIAGLLARGEAGEWALLDGYSRIAPVPSAEALRWHVGRLGARARRGAGRRARPAGAARRASSSLLEQVA